MTSTQQLVNEWSSRTSTGITVTNMLERLSSAKYCQEGSEEMHRGFIATLAEGMSSTYRTSTVTLLERPARFVPRTDLGRKLAMLRRQAVESGMTLWDADTVLAVVKRNRGELVDEEEDIR